MKNEKWFEEIYFRGNPNFLRNLIISSKIHKRINYLHEKKYRRIEYTPIDGTVIKVELNLNPMSLFQFSENFNFEANFGHEVQKIC
jgi:hypothetical protein